MEKTTEQMMAEFFAKGGRVTRVESKKTEYKAPETLQSTRIPRQLDDQGNEIPFNQTSVLVGASFIDDSIPVGSSC
jgi:hypothetical protein